MAPNSRPLQPYCPRPLSHVDLRAKQNNTPNAYLKDAANDPRIVSLVDSIVRFEVKPDDIDIRAASRTEMEEFLDEQQPFEIQFPSRDLTRTEVVRLDEAGHSDLVTIGAKAANVTELRNVLEPHLVPDGYAVPFHLYHRFLEQNGLYDTIRGMTEQERFVTDELFRDEQLRSFRRLIKRSTVPADLRGVLGDMQARFGEEINPRCRSSTNNKAVAKPGVHI
jgi:hypothetical protein